MRQATVTLRPLVIFPMTTPEPSRPFPFPLYGSDFDAEWQDGVKVTVWLIYLLRLCLGRVEGRED